MRAAPLASLLCTLACAAAASEVSSLDAAELGDVPTSFAPDDRHGVGEAGGKGRRGGGRGGIAISGSFSISNRAGNSEEENELGGSLEGESPWAANELCTDEIKGDGPPNLATVEKAYHKMVIRVSQFNAAVQTAWPNIKPCNLADCENNPKHCDHVLPRCRAAFRLGSKCKLVNSCVELDRLQGGQSSGGNKGTHPGGENQKTSIKGIASNQPAKEANDAFQSVAGDAGARTLGTQTSLGSQTTAPAATAPAAAAPAAAAPAATASAAAAPAAVAPADSAPAAAAPAKVGESGTKKKPSSFLAKHVQMMIPDAAEMTPLSLAEGKCFEECKLPEYNKVETLVAVESLSLPMGAPDQPTCNSTTMKAGTHCKCGHNTSGGRDPQCIMVSTHTLANRKKTCRPAKCIGTKADWKPTCAPTCQSVNECSTSGGGVYTCNKFCGRLLQFDGKPNARKHGCNHNFPKQYSTTKRGVAKNTLVYPVAKGIFCARVCFDLNSGQVQECTNLKEGSWKCDTVKRTKLWSCPGCEKVQGYDLSPNMNPTDQYGQQINKWQEEVVPCMETRHKDGSPVCSSVSMRKWRKQDGGFCKPIAKIYNIFSTLASTE